MVRLTATRARWSILIFDDLLDTMKAKGSDLVELSDVVSVHAFARKCTDDVAVVESEWRTQLEMEVGWRNIMQSVRDAKDKCHKNSEKHWTRWNRNRRLNDSTNYRDITEASSVVGNEDFR